MRLETTAASLRAAMDLTRGLIGRGNTIPVLATVKIGGGKVTANNLDMQAEIALPTIGTCEGEAAIDASALAGLSRHVRADETVTLSESDGLANISFNGSEYRLASLPASDFPDFDAVEGVIVATDNMGIVNAMRRVRFAASTEEFRYYLNGVCFFKKPDGVMLCATDGHRLAMVDLPSAPEGSEGKIVPNDCVAYLCARKGEPKAATFENLRARFDYDGLTVSAKLIDGTYPDVARINPKDATPHFTVNRSDALAALRRMACFTGSNWRGVKITGSKDGLVLSMKQGEREAVERVAATVHVARFEAGYNCGYLIDILRHFQADEVTFAAEANCIAGAPALITAEGDALRVVLMPMRV